MDASVLGDLARRMSQIDDPRRPNRIHPLTSILSIAVIAVLCGADGWSDVHLFARLRQDWFASFLALPRGIPSRQTFERVFAVLKPEALENTLILWFKALAELSGGKLLAIDGKALRRSFQHAWDKSGMAYLVSAFASESGLVLAQVEADGKGTELAGIKRLLELIEVKGKTVTIDALGCQKEIAQTICERGGDYVLAVKDNQPRLHAKAKALLDEAILDVFQGMQHSCFEQTNGGHGRIETRRVWCTREIQWLGELAGEWVGLESLVVVESTRQVIGQEPTRERRYYISSLKNGDAKQMAQAIRGHWGIENGLHYVLDVSFGEDASRIHKDHAPVNFSRLRRLTMNMLKQEQSIPQASIKARRKMCGWSEAYLLKVLAAVPATPPTHPAK
jgi:predicted transposase YbfD/YdcC